MRSLSFCCSSSNSFLRPTLSAAFISICSRRSSILWPPFFMKLVYCSFWDLTDSISRSTASCSVFRWQMASCTCSVSFQYSRWQASSQACLWAFFQRSCCSYSCFRRCMSFSCFEERKVLARLPCDRLNFRNYSTLLILLLFFIATLLLIFMNRVKSPGRYSHYLLSNQELLLGNLSLLDLTSEKAQQEVRLTISLDTLNNPKIVWFVLYNCLRVMVGGPEFNKTFEGWYPPRTVSDQLEFKKLCVSQIQKLELQNKIPKNFIVNKSIFDQQDRIVEFLRYLSEFALRSHYLSQFSEPLIQVAPLAVNQALVSPQDINRFYPCIMCPEPPELPETTLQILESHIELQKKQLLSKSTHQSVPPFPQDELINNLFYLQQIKKQLATKVPKQFFTENRAFDRTQILDKIEQMWKELEEAAEEDVEALEVGENTMLEADGEWFQLDKQWEKWLAKIKNDFFEIHMESVKETCSKDSTEKRLKEIKSELKRDIEQFGQFKKKIENALSSI